MKIVHALYRVSSKKQSNIKDDIPMQRNACKEFIAKHEDWKLGEEYIEAGVSGYNKRFKDREILQKAIEDVDAKKFDIFLVFMFDRLGRLDDETPYLLKRIVESGIEVWSVCEGQQKFENASDDLMNYIRFWGAKNESKKTAARVDSGRNYATKQGKFTGGTVPYGYMLKPTGNLDKKGRMINDFVKEPFESGVIKDIFNQLVDENKTLNGIIKYLNIDRELKTRKGCKWNTSTVRNILRNPVYKGYVSYGKTRMFEVKVGDFDARNVQQQKERRQRSVPPEQWILAEEKDNDLVIVSEEKWQMAQDILSRRYKKYQSNLRPIEDRTWKSSLLLVGLLECGYCHGAISPAVSSQKTLLANGEIHRCYTEFYKCNTRGRDKMMCPSKSYISRYKLEKVVLDEVYGFLDRLEAVDCTQEIRSAILGSTSEEKQRMTILQREHAKVESGIKKMQAELYRSFMEDIEIDRKYLNRALEEAEQKQKGLQHEIKELEIIINSKEIAVEEYQKTVKMIPVWKEVFVTAPINIKKRLLSMLIDKIIIKGTEVDIFFKIDIDSFISIGHSSEKRMDMSDYILTTAVEKERESYRKIIEENISVNDCGI